jgi:hypothetical protein
MRNAQDRKRVAEFLGKCILKYHDKSIHFAPQKYLMVGGVSCVGWADDFGVKIATRNEKREWLSWFVHETCHLDQNAAKPKWFATSSDAVLQFEEWLGGRRVKNIDKIIRQCIQLEHDCEERTIRKIHRFKLPINVKEYAQKANAYLLGYYQSGIDRQWCKKSTDEDFIWKSLPQKLFTLKGALKPAKEYLELFE